MYPKVSRIIRNIKSMKIQGAREVAKAGLECFILTAKSSKARNRSEFVKEIRNLAGVLAKTRVTEPMLRNVMKNVLLKLNEYEGFENIGSATVNVCKGEMREMDLALINIAKIGSGQIENGDRVLTHCHSHDVIGIFLEAKKEGKRFEVIVTESRPRLQGILTAKDLLKAGIKVTYCVDSAIGWVMKKIDKVLVGCDAILADGSIVNKIGTFPIALVAEKFGVPFLVAGETLKFDTQTLMGIPEPIEKREAKEIIEPRKLPGARIINPAFDVTPADYIYTLITEKGIMRQEVLRERID
jgi:ribose 1,5-bisphosphate isomerase